MRLTIVIPTKNEEQLLPRLLESLRTQRGVELEVVVADAQSTDQTATVARAFGAQVVHGGLPGVGRNRGAAEAKTEWLCFHDADVLPLSDHFYADVLEELMARAADFATVRLLPEGGRVLDRLWHWFYHVYARLMARRVPRVSGAAFFVKRAWHERLNGFDESVMFAEDMEYARRLAAAGAHFVYLREMTLQTSVRRLRKEGYLGIAWKYLFAEGYMRFRGPIRKELFVYEFRYEREKKS